MRKVKLSESDLTRIVKKVINEQLSVSQEGTYSECLNEFNKVSGISKLSKPCQELTYSEKIDETMIESCKSSILDGYKMSYDRGDYEKMTHFHKLIMCMVNK